MFHPQGTGIYQLTVQIQARLRETRALEGAGAPPPAPGPPMTVPAVEGKWLISAPPWDGLKQLLEQSTSRGAPVRVLVCIQHTGRIQGTRIIHHTMRTAHPTQSSTILPDKEIKILRGIKTPTKSCVPPCRPPMTHPAHPLITHLMDSPSLMITQERIDLQHR